MVVGSVSEIVALRDAHSSDIVSKTSQRWGCGVEDATGLTFSGDVLAIVEIGNGRTK